MQRFVHPQYYLSVCPPYYARFWPGARYLTAAKATSAPAPVPLAPAKLFHAQLISVEGEFLCHSTVCLKILGLISLSTNLEKYPRNRHARDVSLDSTIMGLNPRKSGNTGFEQPSSLDALIPTMSSNV